MHVATTQGLIGATLTTGHCLRFGKRTIWPCVPILKNQDIFSLKITSPFPAFQDALHHQASKAEDSSVPEEAMACHLTLSGLTNGPSLSRQEKEAIQKLLL